MLAPLMLLVLLPGADTDDAEKLFRQMEAKLAKAKTVECTYEAKAEGEKAGRMSGTLRFAEGNKVRFEVTDELREERVKATLIADGTKMTAVGEGVPKEVKDVPKWFSEALAASITRSGLVVVFFFNGTSEKPDEFKVDEQFRVAEFKLGQKERVGDREAQVVRYLLTVKAVSNEPMSVAVWVDTKTQLPLKRVLTAKLHGKKTTLTETYTKLEVDGKIDPKQFELP